MSAGSRTSDEGGFSLIELLVTMALFSVLLAVFGAGLTLMSKDVRHQVGQSDDLDAARRTLDQLDRQVRYANAINTPGSTGSGTTLTYWVEWKSGNVDQQQTCTQWRLTPAGQLQYRTWQPPLSSSAALIGPTAWNTRADHVSSTGNPFSFPTADVLASNVRQQLVVAFTSIYGAPPVRSPSQVTLTAQNTTSSAPLLTPVCQEVLRS